MLETLSTDVYPYYSRLRKSDRALSKLSTKDQAVNLGELPYRDYKRVRNAQSIDMWKVPYWSALPDSELKSALSRWADSFHADIDWVKDEALRILEGWHVNPGWRETLDWRPVRAWLITIPVEEFHPGCWAPQMETWLAYNESLKKKLLEYEKRVREMAESHGLVRAQRKYSPRNFDWFVLYQFAELSFHEIADKWAEKDAKGLDESTVSKGVKAAVELLGWQHLRSPQKKPNRKIQ
jgi:hypothetical protein